VKRDIAWTLEVFGDHDITLGRVQYPASASGEVLLSAIERWLSIQFDLPAIREHPRMPAAKIAALRFKGLLPNPGTEITANDHTPGRAQNETVAVYYDPTQTIYLPEGWTGMTPGELSVLVHEMVHHFLLWSQIRMPARA
jgi:Domain of unknown function (DUF6647)